jgi:hypothetical protein
MWRYFRSPFGAEGPQQSMKRGVSMSDSVGFSGSIGHSSGRVAEPYQRRLGSEEVESPRGSSIEMKIWVVLFGLIILATIALIVVVLMEEPAHAHAALSSRSLIACAPFQELSVLSCQ